MPRLRCPACPSQVLESVHEHGVEIDACVRCGGLWFDAGELAQLLQSYDEKLTPTGKVADGLGKRLGATDLVPTVATSSSSTSYRLTTRSPSRSVQLATVCGSTMTS